MNEFLKLLIATILTVGLLIAVGFMAHDWRLFWLPLLYLFVIGNIWHYENRRAWAGSSGE